MNRCRQLEIVCFALLLTGCGGSSISLKHDVFQDMPLWRSAALGGGAVSLAGPLLIKKAEAPGLYNLVQQVLGPNHPSLDTASPSALGAVSLGGGVTLVADENPLPDELAKLPATRAIVTAIQAVYLKADVPDIQLSSKDFRDLGEEFFRSSLKTYQDPSPARLGKLAAFSASSVHQVSWQAIATAYFTAYYKGKFVDRTGGKLSKPAIGMKIPNETVTSALSVFLEATFDYALLLNKGQVYNPIVYTIDEKGKPSYQTKDNEKPIFVEVMQVAAGQSSLDGVPPTIDGVLEALQTDDTKAGITKAKLDSVRLLSGYAADASGSFADLITRTFGGIHIGVVVLGKVSIGDNDTLAKIVQTTADMTAKRTTEAGVATFLYHRVKPLNPPGELAAPKDVADVLGYTGTEASH